MPCPLCGGTDFVPVLYRQKTMTSANVLYATEVQARNAPVGELTILLCRYCGFVFNSTFNHDLVPYGKQYENDQSKSGRFLSHMQDMAVRVRAAANGRPLRVVEVGCGQGQFLRLVMGDCPAAQDRAVGFDPSYVGEDIRGCNIHRSYFGPNSVNALDFQPNVVISRHVIEHIQDPIGILTSVRIALGPAPEAKVFFETPSIQWIFDNDAFWDLCYEHCSYFTPESLATAFEVSGFEPQKVETVFGGQYLWIEAITSQPKRAAQKPDDTLAIRFARTAVESQKHWRSRLIALSPKGKIAVWGAATKGAMFVLDVDPDGALVDCLIDINPMKQNQYIPLTAHPVVNWQSAIAQGVSTIIVTNPNYLAEIQKTLGSHSLHVNFLSL
jgi:Methyltransferase domain/C-methyltransferase C-terminal domain